MVNITTEIQLLDIQIQVLELAQKHNIDEKGIDEIFGGKITIQQLGEDRIDDIEDEVANREKITDEESERLINSNILNSILGSRPTRVNNLMKSKGDMKIVQYDICRVPINSKIRTLINKLSGGKLEEERKKNNYDDVFHLYLVMTFIDGSVISIEKNEVVVVSNHKPDRKGECKTINVFGSNVTLNRIIPSAEKKLGKNFYRYDARTFNCQNFVLNILHESGVFGFDSFVYQDFQTAISTPLRETSGIATDLAGLVGRFTQLFQPSIK